MARKDLKRPRSKGGPGRQSVYGAVPAVVHSTSLICAWRLPGAMGVKKSVNAPKSVNAMNPPLNDCKNSYCSHLTQILAFSHFQCLSLWNRRRSQKLLEPVAPLGSCAGFNYVLELSCPRCLVCCRQHDFRWLMPVFFHLMTLSTEQWTISLPRLMPVCFPI